jgi:hypothetical protein
MSGKIFIGCDYRRERAGWLVYEEAVCAWSPLACPLTFERAVSGRAEKQKELPPAAEGCEGVSSPGSTSTVRRHARLSDLALEFKDRGRPAEIPEGGWTRGRVFGRLRSTVKVEIPFTSRRRRRALEHLAGIETELSNVSRQASGFRARKVFTYTSRLARSEREL